MPILKVAFLGLFITTQALAFKKDRFEIGPADRKAQIVLPRGYEKKANWPLLVTLHGRGSSGFVVDNYFQISSQQNQIGFISIIPEGTKRSDDVSFWNATPECCDIENTQVDDSGYILGLINEAKERFNVDAERVYILGHSNGGFMANRLACDSQGQITGIASLAGPNFGDDSLCKTNSKISVLHIHGTEDTLVRYDGVGFDYPGARETVARWARRNACIGFEEFIGSKDLLLTRLEPAIDLETGRPKIIGSIIPDFSNESDELTYFGCEENTKVALWTIPGADHVPLFYGKSFLKQVFDFLDN